jgi:hypothetical protein
MYGDDAESATNYPLVRIKNNATGHVFYAKTHNHSTMAVATGSTSVSSDFDVAGATESGASTLAVVANGIPSSATSVTVLDTCSSPTLTCTANPIGCTVVHGQITLSCQNPTSISTSMQACAGATCGSGTGQSGVLTTSSASAGTCGYAPFVCKYTWTIAGQVHQSQITPP